MAEPTKYYYLCNPPHYMSLEQLQLGHILLEATDPVENLVIPSDEDPIPTPERLNNPFVIPHCRLTIGGSSTAYHVTLGIRIAQVFNPHVSAGHSAVRCVSADIENLQTKEFTPTEQYIQKVLAWSANIQHYLDSRAKDKKVTLYMVTGLKIVLGRASLDHQRSKNTTADVAADIPLDGVAAFSVDANMGLARGRETAAQLSMQAPFVFAYRVHGFDVQIKTGDVSIPKAHVRGTVLSLAKSAKSVEYCVELHTEEDGEN